LREATGIQESEPNYHQLIDMSPQYVFGLRLESLGEEADIETLQATFSEALQLMEEREGSL
jgi:hypothetical protein